MSQAAEARRALEEAAAKAKAPPEEAMQSQLSARQQAMANLNRAGVVSTREARGMKGESQLSAAMKNLGVADQPKEKVIPNWKMTGGQKAAHAEKMALRAGGQSQHAAAMKAFSGCGVSSVPSSASSTPRSFVPVQKAGNLTAGRAAAPTSAPAPVVTASAGAGTGAAEAEEGVEKDLRLLTAGIQRLGVADASGAVTAAFGKIVDDEELEQQLESLVGVQLLPCTARTSCPARARASQLMRLVRLAPLCLSDLTVACVLACRWVR